MKKTIVPRKIQFPRWTEPFFHPMRYKVAHGGRGGGKTTDYALILVLRGFHNTLRVMCCREFQNSMEESVKPAIEKAIVMLGLEEFYTVQTSRIVGVNGTVFNFKGIARNIMSIKGWEDYDVCWIEEANTTSAESLRLLKPTIRKPGSEIWFSFNRHNRNDAVDEMFLGINGAPKNAIVVHVNYDQNPFFTKELDDERLLDLETEPARYKHIWEGEPDDNGHEKVILPFEWLVKAVDAHKRLGLDISGRIHTGLDVADTGGDTNAFATRHGSLLKDVVEWNKEFLHQTSTEADERNRDNGSSRMFYDATGMGAGIKSDMDKIENRPYKAKPFVFGGEVNGKELEFSRKRKNKDMFARQNIQAGWNLRLRLRNTMYLLDGRTDINPDSCLFIDGKIKDINGLLKELSQPLYDKDNAGKLIVIKAPHKPGQPKKESPNRYDACIMAFAYDIRRGLKEKR